MNRSICRVFVYGTLKPGGSNFDNYCRDRVIAIDRAYIYGDLYDLPAEGYPAITHGKGRVEGFVLSFPDDRILVDLDELEEYHPQNIPTDNIYHRQSVTTYYLDRPLVDTVWAYIMTLDRLRQFNHIAIASGQWTVDSGQWTVDSGQRIDRWNEVPPTPLLPYSPTPLLPTPNTQHPTPNTPHPTPHTPHPTPYTPFIDDRIAIVARPIPNKINLYNNVRFPANFRSTQTSSRSRTSQKSGGTEYDSEY